MKHFKVAMTLLIGLIVFSIAAAMVSQLDIGAFLQSPIAYLADHFNPSGVLMATFSATPLTWSDGTENMGGFKNYIDIIPIADIDTEADLYATPTTDEEHVTIDGSHTLVSLKYWKRVYVTPGTLKYTPENQGEIDGQSFKQKGAFFHPGSSDAVNAFARQVNNGNFILLLHEENGQRIQVGSVGHPARLKPAPDFGMAAADRKGFTFEFEADGFVAAVRYKGTIPLSAVETEPAIS